MKKITIFMVLMLVVYNVYGAETGAGNYCLYKGAAECWWCNTGGAIPPGNCVQGYAGCSTSSHISQSGDSPLTENDGTTITKWTCGRGGWTSTKTPVSGGGGTCDRYSYRDENGVCHICPDPDFVSLETGEAPFPRGDNYYFLLTGCNIQVDSYTQYSDTSGLFNFGNNVQCYHDGKL